MNIEEMAKKWSKDVDFECKGPAKHAYIEGYRAALTSLLEELPEVEDDTHNDYNLGRFNGQEAYRENIINLIQNKLK